MKDLKGFTVTAVPNEQDYVARLRIVLAVALAMMLAAGVVGCSSTKEAEVAVPVDASKAPEETGSADQEGSAAGAEGAASSSEETTSTTVVRSATSMGPGGSSVSSTTSPEQTLPTLPLRYAEETPLLKEVATAYYAGYNDFARAELALTPDSPELANHIGGPQLDTWRTLIRGDLFDGLGLRTAEGVTAWVRIETLERRPDGDVALTVCRSSNLEAFYPETGALYDTSPFTPVRYIEAMHNENGVWKWWSRERIDTGENTDYSDCALP